MDNFARFLPLLFSLVIAMLIALPVAAFDSGRPWYKASLVNVAAIPVAIQVLVIATAEDYSALLSPVPAIILQTTRAEHVHEPCSHVEHGCAGSDPMPTATGGASARAPPTG